MVGPPSYLIRGVVVLLEVGVCQCVLHSDALVGVEREHLVEQIESLGVSTGVQLAPRHLGLDGQGLEVPSRLHGTRLTSYTSLQHYPS